MEHHRLSNSSPINDGASAVLITSSETAARLGLRPLARLHSFAVTGSDPLLMLTGVIPATEKVLRRASLTLDDIDLFEVNEAFSSVVLAWQQETGADLAKVNVHGGAIAIGHPLGASGTRLTTTLVHAMRDRGGALRTADDVRGGRPRQRDDPGSRLTPWTRQSPRRWWRLRQATTAPPRAGRAMQAIAIRKTGDVGLEARAPATT